MRGVAGPRRGTRKGGGNGSARPRPRSPTTTRPRSPGVPRAADVEERPSLDGGPGRDLLQEGDRVLARLTHAGADGGEARRVLLRQQDLARARPRGADDLRRGHVVSQHVAELETSGAWRVPVRPVGLPAPGVVVCDGGAEFEVCFVNTF